MHRDIKPDNILIEKNQDYSHIKLIDFGSSKQFKDGEYYSEVKGTPYYMSPETLRRKHNYKCDIWSIGVITFILLSGKVPFKGENEELFDNIKSGNYHMNCKCWESVS